MYIHLAPYLRSLKKVTIFFFKEVLIVNLILPCQNLYRPVKFLKRSIFIHLTFTLDYSLRKFMYDRLHQFKTL